MKKWILGVVLAGVAAIAWALPTLQDVEGAVRAGNYSQAETMMREVVAAKPDSAKAHYVYAEILAHDRKFTLAAEEAQKARVLDPAIKFADPEKFRNFERELTQAQQPATRSAPDVRRTEGAAPMAPAPAVASSGIPSWLWLVGLVVVGALLWRGFSRSRNAAAMGGMAGPGAAYGAGVPGQPGAPGMPGAPYAPGYPQPGYAPQRGSMLGTGLAAAGGVAAGMLASEMLHRHQSGSAVNDGDGGAHPGYVDGGNDARQALEDRPIDFGNGNDWDAGGGDVGGGSDLGGGGDGGWD